MQTPWAAIFGAAMPFEYDWDRFVRVVLARRKLRRMRGSAVEFHPAGTYCDFPTLRVGFDEDSEWRRAFLAYADEPPPREQTYAGLGISVPTCHHGVPARQAVVKPSNAKGNAGRVYFGCGAPVGFMRRCDFFLWADDLDQVEPWRFIAPDPRFPTPRDVAAQVALPDDERLRLWSAVEQGSPEWLHIRRNPWATASSIGHLLEAPKVCGLTLRKVWIADGGRGTSATRHGHLKEDDAVELVRRLLRPRGRVRFSVQAGYGTWVSASGATAVSPDGVVFVYRQRGTAVELPHCVFGLECKAPYSSRDCARDAWVYQPERTHTHVEAAPIVTPPCSAVYYAQVQTVMRELGLRAMLFVAVTSRAAQVSLIPFNPAFADHLAAVAQDWCKTLVPLMAARNCGTLAPGHAS